MAVTGKCICSKEQEITEIHTKITKVETQMDLVYKELMGNGRPGMISQWNQLKGSINLMKFFIGGGGLIAILALVLSIFG